MGARISGQDDVSAHGDAGHLDSARRERRGRVARDRTRRFSGLRLPPPSLLHDPSAVMLSVRITSTRLPDHARPHPTIRAVRKAGRGSRLQTRPRRLNCSPHAASEKFDERTRLPEATNALDEVHTARKTAPRCCPNARVVSLPRPLDHSAFAIVATATFLIALSATGCSHVAPYERGKLANPTMSADDLGGPGDGHVRAVLEGAAGGSLGAESGCGCN